MRWGTVIIIVVAVIAAPIIWYIGARPLAALIQSNPVSGFPLKKIGWNGTYLTIDGRTMGLDVLNEKQDLQNTQHVQFGVDAQHRLTAAVNGQIIVLGPRNGTVSNGGEANLAYGPASGDRITFARGEGWLAWPNWFEMNFITGAVPTWKRFVTYRLIWKKASGQTLELVWRYEHYYYPADGWLDADMSGPNCGLVRAAIYSASPGQ